MSHERLRWTPPPPRPGRQIPEFFRNPIRAAAFVGAVAAILGALLPFMRVWTPGVGWFDVSGFARAGDGGWVFEVAIVAAILAWSDRAWNSHVPAVVAGPAILGAGALAILRDFYQDGATYLDGIHNSGGHGTFSVGFWLAIAGSALLLLAGLASVWQARRRVSFRPGTRTATTVAAAIGGAAGGVGGFLVATVVTPLLLHGATVATTSTVVVFVSIVLLAVGAWIGATVAAGAVRSLRPR